MKGRSQPLTGGATENEAPPATPMPARLLRLPEVMERVGLRRSAIYQRMSEGRFPRARSLGPKCTVWIEAEIDQWIQDVVQDRL